MTAVETWGGDAMPPGVHISSEHRVAVMLSARGARRLTDEIRGHLQSGLEKLAQARSGGADQALGYPSWHAYCEAEFGDLREMRLPVAERRALHASMADAGLSRRECAAKTGFSLGTVQADLVATGHAVVELKPAPVVDPYEGLSRTAETLARVRAQGARGLTSTELDLETSWPTGTATATLSRLERRGLIGRVQVFRGNRAAYVAAVTE